MFSSKVQIPPSATVTINTIAQQKKLAGQRVFNLSAGEPIMNTAKYMRETVDWAMDNGQTLYPPVAGIEELRTRAAKWMNETYETEYHEKNTIVTCGGKFGIYLLLQAFLNDGDEVVIIAPYWVSYPSMVRLFGGVPVTVETTEENNWKATAMDIEKACTSRTKMIILNNASNPTGTMYTRHELNDILETAAGKNILVMSDEVYSGLTYDGRQFISCGSFTEYREHVTVVQSCSKNFGMTGWRVGFVFGREDIIKMLAKIQGQSITGTSTISQWAAIAALQEAKTITAEINREMVSRRDIFINTFNGLFPEKINAPHSTFYSFIPLKAFGTKETDDVKFCEKVLEEGNVAMVPGTAFGKPGFVRASFGEKPEELKSALNALATHLAI